jgi:thiamine-phosphate pyrophosphorylase
VQGIPFRAAVPFTVTICLVTDRRRLAPDASLDLARERVAAQARAAVHAAVDLIQIRERDLEASDLAGLVVAVRAVTRGTPTRVVVNDRLDVALACGADGVHLRADSISVDAVRRIAPEGFLVGRSVHGVADVPGAAGADYLIAGTIFPSASKEQGHATIGADGLRAIVAASSAPVLAIGGIVEDRLEDVAAAGAAGIAAIGVFASADPPSMKNLVDRMRLRFDRLRNAP